jgi:hypothetical protein
MAQDHTLSSAGTSSPNVNDQLREDIIRTLSPVATPLAASQLIGTQSKTEQAARESVYLSDVYDDYLGAPEEKILQETGQALKQANASLDERPAPLPKDDGLAQRSIPDVAPLSPRKTPQPETATGPKRFSWEQNLEDPVIPSPAEAPRSVLSPEAADGKAKIASPPLVSPASTLQADNQPASQITHQVSQVSILAPGSAALEPPSPVSVTSGGKGSMSVLSTEKESETTSKLVPEKATDAVHMGAPETAPEQQASEQPPPTVPGIGNDGDRRLSLAEEKVLLEQPGDAASSSPTHVASPLDSYPVEQKTAATPESPGLPSGANSKILGWREILNKPSPEQRIQAFEEARQQYAAMDSGLSGWIMQMASQPDPSDTATSPGQGPRLASGTPASPGASPGGASLPTPQPYYQQYLNASNPSLAGSHAGLARPSTGNMLQGQQQSPGGYGNSGNQVGAKSKELLHAAGVFGNKATKSGLKLFNKGKNRLRGADKVN